MYGLIEWLNDQREKTDETVLETMNAYYGLKFNLNPQSGICVNTKPTQQILGYKRI